MPPNNAKGGTSRVEASQPWRDVSRTNLGSFPFEGLDSDPEGGSNELIGPIGEPLRLQSVGRRREDR